MTAQTYSSNNSGWSVTGQHETQQLGSNGQFVTGHQIGFTTNAGAVGSVFVPDTQLQPDVVRMLIDAKAAQLDAVLSLSSGS